MVWLPRLLLLVPMSLIVVACGGSELVLPDRSSADVYAEERRVENLLEATTNTWIPGQCSVRLLGVQGATSFVWAKCSDGTSGISAPFRIDDERVTATRDGSFWSDDVNEMFPPEIAEAIFDRDERIFP